MCSVPALQCSFTPQPALPRLRGAVGRASSGDGSAVAEGTAYVPWWPVSGSQLFSPACISALETQQHVCRWPVTALPFTPSPRAEEAPRPRVGHPAPHVFKAQVAPKGLVQMPVLLLRASCPHLYSGDNPQVSLPGGYKDATSEECEACSRGPALGEPG